MKIHESEYGGSPLNFHVNKYGAELHVDLTYPPYTNEDNKSDRCRYVVVNQEGIRGSDGVRLHYDYDRDGFMVEQPTTRYVKLRKGHYDTVTDWTEVGFFKSWAREPDGETDEIERAKFAVADAAFEVEKVQTK